MDRCLVVINLAMVVINPACLANQVCQECLASQVCQGCNQGCHHKIYNPNWTSAPWCGVLWKLQLLSKDSHWFWWWATGRHFWGDFFFWGKNGVCYSWCVGILVFLFATGGSLFHHRKTTWKPLICWVFNLWYVGSTKRRSQEDISNFGNYSWRIVKHLPSIVLSTSWDRWGNRTVHPIVGWEFHIISVHKVSLGITVHTVDGQNPAPPRMMIIPLFIGF